MGIKGLNAWIHATFSGVMIAVDEQGGATYDHVLFDLNGIVHTACRRREKEKDVLRTITNELDALLREVAAIRSLRHPGLVHLFAVAAERYAALPRQTARDSAHAPRK